MSTKRPRRRVLKYLYIIGFIVSCYAIKIGKGHYEENGYDVFNVSFMLVLPLIIFILSRLSK
jgi:hypothetical protein